MQTAITLCYKIKSEYVSPTYYRLLVFKYIEIQLIKYLLILGDLLSFSVKIK